MKTLIFTLSTLALFINSKVDNNLSESLNLETTTTELSNVTCISGLVKATLYDGEIIPSIELPTLNVVGHKEQGNKVLTTVVDGERIPVVTLAELTIEG